MLCFVFFKIFVRIRPFFCHKSEGIWSLFVNNGEVSVISVLWTCVEIFLLLSFFLISTSEIHYIVNISKFSLLQIFKKSQYFMKYVMYASSRVTFTNASACTSPQVCLQFSKKKINTQNFTSKKKGVEMYFYYLTNNRNLIV